MSILQAKLEAANYTLDDQQIKNMVTSKWEALDDRDKGKYIKLAELKYGTVDIQKQEFIKKEKRKKVGEVEHGEPLADDILPNHYPLAFGEIMLNKKTRW